jgi:thiamine kinase-like enzyme
MNNYILKTILKATNAKDIEEIETIQELWSGYGKILRIHLKDSPKKTIVLKHVHFPNKKNHPRGWNTDLSHKRKRKSYKIETAWYKQWSNLCDAQCRIPACLALQTQGEEVLIIMEDLIDSGFTNEFSSIDWPVVKTCLSWLANFHATFINTEPENLWKNGTYWHLATRPDELKALTDIELKKSAQAIDQKLRNSPFQTFVHGDAKLANFCFTEDGSKVAAVDFQYVGGGCGMKDVAYFIGSCFNEAECESFESQILDFYFNEIKNALKIKNKDIDASALEANWRSLYSFAWTDFHRFLKGWSPGHWKINSYSERVAQKVIMQLKDEKAT